MKGVTGMDVTIEQLDKEVDALCKLLEDLKNGESDGKSDRPERSTEKIARIEGTKDGKLRVRRPTYLRLISGGKDTRRGRKEVQGT